MHRTLKTSKSVIFFHLNEYEDPNFFYIWLMYNLQELRQWKIAHRILKFKAITLPIKICSEKDYI